ncbi:alkanesulfonate monooxygenase SsuD/methylene tetrahydromethanopterin reductase-like flavin-dependent oxidoreductase (luciferase family) [Kibdelosporangium banguiense]|uniref:Alkanesulfonate monooxygenase SsuD/methylene tetrahydromethanopterin reductase-like flavin-dependent oxidoreductase (Luciferase family) n=1 Tax=Kibdelosporangium banguiense TaxID=1365924 RepID=A0ABS4TP62_9PSEU|nr:LLM class flavin-dependent oxidoreductase [Kibdelosporangium banguiense]MBP2326192.1 alkanesulfonate monooxygenase SsuD/methylene tetrahydromethanopterin reductase-like flavin-dependent oxidoreductase (luciferase family) [Kibdelosporangium banguiense]
MTLHLAVALDGAGWHPAAWREPDARPRELLTAQYWTDLIRTAESGKLDFVTIEDSLGPGPDGTDQVRGRLDAVLIASRVAPLTSHIGLLPTAVATHTEPFHLSKAIATLDYVSNGRAGVNVEVSTDERDYRHFGRRAFPSPGLLQEAKDYIEVLRRLWDSWQDDAEIRDVATGRFVDREKLHYIDFEGQWFAVKGPSITPRPPQGQPLVAGPYANDTDIVFTEPDAPIEHERTFADVRVLLDSDAKALADQVITLSGKGFAGVRLHPGRLPHDLDLIVSRVVPELQERGVFRREYQATTLRGLFGLPKPANRYAA